MKTAYVFAECSSATRLKVGAVLVKNNRILSCGYNALCEHINGPLEDDQGDTRPEVRHAEMNALNALRKLTETSVGSTLFCTHACCKMCAIDIVDSGIVHVYYSETYRRTDGLEYLQQNGVKVTHLPIKSIL